MAPSGLDLARDQYFAWRSALGLALARLSPHLALQMQPEPLHILKLPCDPIELAAGETLELEFVLLSSAITHAKDYCEAFALALAGGVGKSGQRLGLQLLSAHEMSNSNLLQLAPIPNPCIVRALSPWQLESRAGNSWGARLLVDADSVTIELIFARLLRRLSKLSQQPLPLLLPPELDVQAQINLIGRTNCRRYSARQRQSHPAHGWLLDVSLRGDDLALLTPLLRMGELLHIGRLTSAGHGQYQILPD